LTSNGGAGKERYGGTEFGEQELIEKKKLDVVCIRYGLQLYSIRMPVQV
jgi:hypothetical protein